MLKKINEIFELLIDKNTYSKNGISNEACYWKIGTSIFNTLDRLSEKISNVDIANPITSIIDENSKSKKGNNNLYQLQINGVNITPAKDKKSVSGSAIHQYKSMICAFGLGFEAKEYKNKKDFFHNCGQLKLAANIKNLISKENRVLLIKRLIVNSFFNNISDLRNIAYSILMEVLFKFNFNFDTYLNAKNKKFNWKKSIGTKGNKEFSVIELTNANIEKIRADIKKQGTDNTYKEIIEFIANKYSNWEEFILDIWEEYLSIIDKNSTNTQINKQIADKQIEDFIKNERSKFKDNIFNDRKIKGLINAKSDFYADVVCTDGTKVGAKFSESNAAHILPVAIIKDKIKNLDNKNIKELLNCVSDPNNGLMLNIEYHDTFDRNLWTFDASGDMLFSKENEKYLFMDRNLKKIKIKENVFNEKMKDYLKNRI